MTRKEKEALKEYLKEVLFYISLVLTLLGGIIATIIMGENYGEAGCMLIIFTLSAAITLGKISNKREH